MRVQEREIRYQSGRERFATLREWIKAQGKKELADAETMFEHYYYVIYSDLKCRKGYQMGKDDWVSVSYVRRVMDGLSVKDMQKIVERVAMEERIYHAYTFFLRGMIEAGRKREKQEKPA
jgi:hypothetical protein